MTYDFDHPIDRFHSDSMKWHSFPEDVLPLPVADMDFEAPEPVVRALRQRVEHPVFGYGIEPPELRPLLVERLQRLYSWQVEPDAIVFLPGVVPGVNLAARAVAGSGAPVLTQPPTYPPLLWVAENNSAPGIEAELQQLPDGTYTVDLAQFERAVAARHPRLFVLCSPHNPVGRVWSKEELEGMAEICLRHNVLICSDEIHCDLVFGGRRHIPIASISPEIGRRCITLMAPSKTFNIAGLNCAFAVIEDYDLRRRFRIAGRGLLTGVNVMGFAAATAAYAEGGEWLEQLLVYLEANRDLLYDYVNTRLPGVSMARPEGTFLAWLDCRQAGINGNPQQFFLEKGHIGLNDGRMFGQGGDGFVRLNFACPRATLETALERMESALHETV